MSFEFTFHTRKIFSLNFIVVYIYHSNSCYLIVTVYCYLLRDQKVPHPGPLSHPAWYYSASQHMHPLFIPNDPEYPVNNKLVLFFQPYQSSFQLFVFFASLFFLNLSGEQVENQNCCNKFSCENSILDEYAQHHHQRRVCCMLNSHWILPDGRFLQKSEFKSGLEGNTTWGGWR